MKNLDMTLSLKSVNWLRVALVGGIAFVLIAAITLGTFFAKYGDLLTNQYSDFGAGAEYTNADGVRLVLDNITVDDSVKSLEIYLTGANGQKLDEWSKAEDDKRDSAYRIFDRKGVGFSYLHSYFTNKEFKKTNSVNVKFVVNGETFNKKISVVGKTYKKLNESTGTYYSYGDAMKWNISSSGIKN